jgi:hypothetical protein
MFGVLPHTSADDIVTFLGTLACSVARFISDPFLIRGEENTLHHGLQGFFCHQGLVSENRRLHQRNAEYGEQRDADGAGEEHLVDY